MTSRLRSQPLLLLLTALPLVLAIFLGHEGSRFVQLWVLALFPGVWLCWPHRSARIRWVQFTLVLLFGVVFILDGAVRGFIKDTFDALPGSTLVLTAVANTTPQESVEFFSMYGTSIAAWSLVVLVSCGLLWVSLKWWLASGPAPIGIKGWRLFGMVVLLVVMATALLNKPWRRHHPVLHWTDWVQDVVALRRQWADMEAARHKLSERANAMSPSLTERSPDTLVLVLSESINRGNLSLYGYPRSTTPQLVSRQTQSPEDFRVCKHAWSVDASTVPALRSFFHLGEQGENRQHLLALAASAGYQIWWISNHDDLAIEQEHARFAHQVRILNQTPGRSSSSLDHNTVPVLEEALQADTPRKLIVLHLLGAHPHYRLRHAQDTAPFKNAKDHVYQTMQAQGRSAWVREMRNDYDSAIHYHDSVVTSSYDLTRRLGGDAVWLYFSDHGQEVGMVSNHAGHSLSTAEGYRVPLLMWGRALTHLPQEASMRPVRTDWLGHTVMDLMGIEWAGHQSDKNVLDPQYRWQAPTLPVSVNFSS